MDGGPSGHVGQFGLVVLVGPVGGLFKWMWNRVFGGKDRRSESDPQALTKALHRYEELIETKDSLREAEEQVEDLRGFGTCPKHRARGRGIGTKGEGAFGRLCCTTR